MMTCSHLSTIEDVSPSALGCEECLKIGSEWGICVCVGSAAMSVAATSHLTGMRAPILTQPAIP